MVQDIREENTSAPLFSRQDFDRIMDKMNEEVVECVQGELENFYRMAAVFLQMVLFEAEEQAVTLNADTKLMDNIKAINEMRDLESMDSASLGSKRSNVNSRLPALGAKANDPKMEQKFHEVENEN